MMRKILLFLIIASGVSSCYYDNASELYPLASLNQNCDTVDVTYTKNIEPLFKTNCGTNNSCHSAGVADGGIILDSYSAAAAVDANLLLGSAQQDQGYIPMPPAGKMSDCGIRQLQLWIQNGKPL